MTFIAIVTDSKSEEELKRVIDKQITNNSELMFIRDKNLENIRNIKLETLIINTKISNKELIEKIASNSKYLIFNNDLNNLEEYNFNVKKIITYGYNSKSDITVSSREEDKSLLSLQKTIKSIFGKIVEIQDIRADVAFDINIYDIMIIVALTLFYAK